MDLYRIVNFVLCLVIHCTDVEKIEPAPEVIVRSSIEKEILNVTLTPATVATTLETMATTIETVATTSATVTTTEVPTSDTMATTSILPFFNQTADDANVADNELDLSNDIRRRRGLEIQQEDMLRLSATALPKGNGAHCQFNPDCISGCCLAQTREERHCSPMAVRGDQCEIAQIKGGFYSDFCPCAAGDSACFAAAKGQRQLLCSQ